MDRPTREYHHDAGKLEKTVQHWPGSGSRPLFVAKSKTTLRDLSQSLSRKIAAATLSRLAQAELGAPLVALELGYRDGDRHIPMLVLLMDSLGKLDARACAQSTRFDFAPFAFLVSATLSRGVGQ